MPMRKGENERAVVIQKYVDEKLPGVRFKPSVPNNKGAYLMMEDGVVIAQATSNHKLEDIITAPNFKNKTGYRKFFEIPRTINIKMKSEKLMAKGVSLIKEAIEITGEKNPRLLLNERGIPQGIKTKTSEYNLSKKSEK